MTSKMTTTSIGVTKDQSTMNFTLTDTSTNHLVMAMLDKIGVFPIVMSYMSEEPISFLFCLVRMNLLNKEEYS